MDLNPNCELLLIGSHVTTKDGSATRELQLRRLQPGLQPVAEP